MREKEHIRYKRKTNIRLAADFSSKTVQDKSQRHAIFKKLEGEKKSCTSK